MVSWSELSFRWPTDGYRRHGEYYRGWVDKALHGKTVMFFDTHEQMRFLTYIV